MDNCHLTDLSNEIMLVGMINMIEEKQHIKHNQASAKKWERLFSLSFIEIVKNLNWGMLGQDNNMFDRFVCVSCGQKVNMANLNFYDFDITRVKCYGCQREDDKEQFVSEYKKPVTND